VWSDLEARVASPGAASWRLALAWLLVSRSSSVRQRAQRLRPKVDNLDQVLLSARDLTSVVQVHWRVPTGALAGDHGTPRHGERVGFASRPDWPSAMAENETRPLGTVLSPRVSHPMFAAARLLAGPYPGG
jgi:hypothetical protein